MRVRGKNEREAGKRRDTGMGRVKRENGMSVKRRVRGEKRGDYDKGDEGRGGITGEGNGG